MNNIPISVISFQPDVAVQEKQLIEFLNVFWDLEQNKEKAAKNAG